MRISDCGILFRGYAKETTEVSDVVRRLTHSVMQAHSLGFGHIVVLVPSDKDCGETMFALAERLPKNRALRNVTQVAASGNENSDVLNRGLEVLRVAGISYAFIVSNKAVEAYLTSDNVGRIRDALGRGALASGLAVREVDLLESEDEVFRGVLEGRLVNTFAAWNLFALHQVGDFDSQIGVEEIAPLVRLAINHKSCITPVLPTEYAALNVSALRAAHHVEVRSTKRERQLAEAARAHGSFELIRREVLEYRP